MIVFPLWEAKEIGRWCPVCSMYGICADKIPDHFGGTEHVDTVDIPFIKDLCKSMGRLPDDYLNKYGHHGYENFQSMRLPPTHPLIIPTCSMYARFINICP